MHVMKNSSADSRKEIVSISRKNVNQNQRRIKKMKKMRNLRTAEVTLFAEVLSDDVFSFGECLEERSPNK